MPIDARDDIYRPGDLVVGRYQLIRPIGKGGMGVVWVARSLVLDVDVALKLIPSSEATPIAAARMTQEARAAAQLGHPALVRASDFGETERGDPFLVMELLHGQSLAAALSTGPLEATRAVQLLLPIADGLATAHERGIVHRDLKPDNIFIARDEFSRIQPKLLDFGIAKLRHLPPETKLTQAGFAVGSPGYMAPEQASGRDDIDYRADVWAFCVVLYECITSRMPFEASNYNALMHAIMRDEPTPTTAFGVGDEALWQILIKGMAKRRNQRFGSIYELGRALAEWLVERRVNEDACGMSLRSTWLDGSESRLSIHGSREKLHSTPLDGESSDNSDRTFIESLPGANGQLTSVTASLPGAAPAPPRPRSLPILPILAGALAAAVLAVAIMMAYPPAPNNALSLTSGPIPAPAPSNLAPSPRAQSPSAATDKREATIPSPPAETSAIGKPETNRQEVRSAARASTATVSGGPTTAIAPAAEKAQSSLGKSPPKAQKRRNFGF